MPSSSSRVVPPVSEEDIAHTLARAGAKVAITGRDRARLEAGRAGPRRARHSGRRVERGRCLPGGSRSARRLRASRRAGQQCRAGVFAPLVDMRREDSSAVIATNVTGAMLMARAAARHFVKRRSPATSSTSAPRPHRRRTQRHRLLRQQVRAARDDRVLARRVAAVERAGDPDQSERGDHRSSAPTPACRRQRRHRPSCGVDEIAHAVKSSLEMDDRGFVTELTVFATNPQD